MIDQTNTHRFARRIYEAATRRLSLPSAGWAALEAEVKTILDEAVKPPAELEQIHKIQAAVARAFAVEIDVMTSARRTRDEVFPRQVAMYLCTKRTAAPLHAIARAFGKKERGTITYAIDTVVEKMKKDSETRRTVEGLMNNLLF